MTIKTLVKHASASKRIPILGQIRVIKGVMQSTDIDFWISAPCNLKDGMYYREGFDRGIQIKSEFPVKDFPEPVKMNKEYEIYSTSIESDRIAALEWVMTAASKEVTRYYLNGIYFDWAEQDGVVVATDGHRLHSFKHQIEGVRPKKKRQKINGKYKMVLPSAGAIMPTRAVKIILDLVKENKADRVDLKFNGLKFTAAVGNALVEGKLIDGTYPDWRRVVMAHPKENTTPFDPAQIKALMPELTVLAKINSQKTVGLVIKGGVAEPYHDTSKSGKSWPVLLSFPFPYGFNGKFLSELCGGMAEFTDASSPMNVRDRRGGIERLAVVMPLRI